MSCSRVPGGSELRWGRENKSSVLSQLSKGYRLYGLLNILWLIFRRKSNPLHVGRSSHSHLSRLKAWDDSATAPLRWDVSHFPTEPALYRTTNWLFMTLYVSRRHIIYSRIESALGVTLLLFQGQYREVPQNAQVTSCFTLERVIQELNHSGFTSPLSCLQVTPEWWRKYKKIQTNNREWRLRCGEPDIPLRSV